MIITVASFKGGVGKTTTAVHLACYLQERAPTLLVDGDPNRAASEWSSRGGLPVKVVTEKQMPRYLRDFNNVVIDTQAHPSDTDLRDLADACDLLILPTTPDALSLNALTKTAARLDSFGARNFRVLLSIVPPRPNHDADDAREFLAAEKLPVFKQEVRRLIAFQRAALHGVPVFETTEPRAQDGWSDYQKVGREITK
jgi:chromosome partitioning protein